MSVHKQLDIIYHPARIRIIRLLALKELTTREIGKVLSDIPPGSLYRHIKLLLDGGFLEVVKSIQKRGTIEKYYRFKQGSTDITLSKGSKESLDSLFLLEQFHRFIETINQDYQNYLDAVTEERERIGYNQYILYLTKEERDHFDEKVLKLLDEYDYKPSDEPGRKPWIVSSIIAPSLENIT